MLGVRGNGVFRSWPLYFMHMVNAGVSPAAPSIPVELVAVLGGGNSLTLGRRKLMPSLEQVTCSVPTVTPNDCSDPFASLAARKEVFDLLDSLWPKLTRSPLSSRFGR
jgi:hypothetical protein